MSAARPVPAVLQAAVETETDYGGREATWSPIAAVWVSMNAGPPNQKLDGAAASPAETEGATALARDHPLAAADQQLLVGDDPVPWRVRRVDRDVPLRGRMTLRLDRLT